MQVEGRGSVQIESADLHIPGEMRLRHHVCVLNLLLITT